MTLSQNKLFSLNGRNALITGATGYLGKEMTQTLAEAGAHVIICGRRHERLHKLHNELAIMGYSAECLIFDVADSNQIETAIKKINERPLHILINNAYSGGAGTIEHSDSSEYRHSYDVTVVAAHCILRAALPALRLAVRTDESASVINVASMYGLVSPDKRIYDSPAVVNPPFYGSSKAALIQWTRYAACEFGPEGIRVNSISPGAFPAIDVLKKNPEFVKRLEVKIPLGRVGRASEISGPLLFLASSASSYVNGANLCVDGGWTAW